MLSRKWVRGKNLRVLNTVIKPENIFGMKVRNTVTRSTKKYIPNKNHKNNTIDNYYKPLMINKLNNKKRIREEYENEISIF